MELKLVTPIFTILVAIIAFTPSSKASRDDSSAELSLRGRVREQRDVHVEMNSTGNSLLIRSTSNSSVPVKLRVGGGRAPASVSVIGAISGDRASEAAIEVPLERERTKVTVGVEAP